MLPMMLARAADPPEVKEGLWEIHNQSVEHPGNKKDQSTYKLCRDHAFDKEALATVKNLKGCTFNTTGAGGSRCTPDGLCKTATTVIATKGASTYLNGSALPAEAHSTYTPAFAGKPDNSTIQDQKYLRSCPAGMKPAERSAADGTVERRVQ